MKIKNYCYLLLPNVIITSLLLIYYFNIVGVLSLVLSIIYFGMNFFSKYTQKYLNIIFLSSLLSGIAYYFLYPIFKEINITKVSFLPSLFLILSLISAIRMPRLKRNWFSGVRTSLALRSDYVWKKVNNIGSIINYLAIFPLFILIFYLNDNLKLTLSILIVLLYVHVTIIIAFIIERKYKQLILKEEKINLEHQRKLETGG